MPCSQVLSKTLLSFFSKGALKPMAEYYENWLLLAVTEYTLVL